MHVRYCLAAVILTLAPALTIAQSPIAIGVVREDGILIPVISILGDKHHPLLEGDAVFTRAAHALPNSWEFWRIGNRRPIPITTTARRMVESHCSEQEVWTTTLKVAEARVVNENPDDQAAQIPSAVRARTNVQIEKLLRRSTQGDVVYFFEATKSYGEFVGTRTTGWVMLSASGNNTFGEDTNPLSGEAGAVTVDALGVVRSGSSELWVLQRNGYESESYVVYQWPKGLQLVDLFGGGC